MRTIQLQHLKVDSRAKSTLPNPIPDTVIVPSKERNSKTSIRINDCKTQRITINRRCNDCGKKAVPVSGHCFVRYCSNCYTSKFQRSRKRLAQYEMYFDGICKHIQFTIPRQKYSKELKRSLERSVALLIWRLRHKHNYQFIGVKIFDYGNPSDLQGMITNVHIHMAMNMLYTIPASLLSKIWRDVTGIPNAIVKIKKSRTKAVLKYFARRVAGDFGHGMERRSFDSVMTLEQYEKFVYRTRAFTVSFPKGYPCKHRAVLSQKCSYCGGDLRLSSIEQDGVITFDNNRHWDGEDLSVSIHNPQQSVSRQALGHVDCHPNFSIPKRSDRIGMRYKKLQNSCNESRQFLNNEIIMKRSKRRLGN